MLARSAAGLYWMGRYLERAGHLSRLMKQEVESLVDSPPRDIYFGWHRMYGALERQPYPRALELDTDDLTFEPTNPDSIRSCFAQGRENARQMRHHISAEMWWRINRSYLRLKGIEIRDIWLNSPENFYAETTAEIDTFRGVTSSTLYRDDAWHFLQLGSCLERAQLSSSLLLAQVAAVRLFEVPADAYWTSLLRHYYAFEAYNQTASSAIEPDRVLDLLVTNPQLPDSLSLSVSEVSEELVAVGSGPDSGSTDETRNQAERIRRLVIVEWPMAADRARLLAEIRSACMKLHELITTTYFDYPIVASLLPSAGGHAQ